MAQPVLQASFNSGEWAPHLWARTDIEKYHSGAALLRNFFVDYRGGASTRSGSRYIIRGYKDSTTIRLIGFQASITVGYVLELGDQYMRFHQNGAPILEAGLNITGVTKANPCVVTVNNSYTGSDTDWIYISGVGGMTQLNGKFFKVRSATASQITLDDLSGNPVDSTTYGTYTSGGTTQRIFTISTPWAAADLAKLKFIQDVSAMFFCHPNYPPYQLTFSSATSWNLGQIIFGSSIGVPTNVTVTTTLGTGANWNYSYVVTAVDSIGQESQASTPGTLSGHNNMIDNSGSNSITWTAVTGASYYNVYKAIISETNAVPTGVSFGYIGFTNGTTFIDSNIAADFSSTPPIAKNPFAAGSSVVSVTITAAGNYSVSGVYPTVSFNSPPTGVTANGLAVIGIRTYSLPTSGSGYSIGDIVQFPNGSSITVTSTAGPGSIASSTLLTPGTFNAFPPRNMHQVSTTGSGSGATLSAVTMQVVSVAVIDSGNGYLSAPTVTFSSGTSTATGTANISDATTNNPSVPGFFQERLVLAAPLGNPQTIYMSQPGLFFDFDIHNPVQDDDGITATIVSGTLNNIKALIPQPSGLIVFTDGTSFLINGGSFGSSITPISISSNPQAYVGANDMPPIVVNYDILSVPAKGSSVRDSSYNFYANVFTGSDISILSSHLFFGYQLLEWAWAEEPYKIVWAIRNDGTLLSLTFLKEQDFIGWAHSDTDGSFKSVATIVEVANVGYQNFLYTVVERTIDSQTVQYIEYFPERATSDNAADYTTVDCSISYSGSPTTTFSGGEFLVGKTCTGLADGVPITPFVMPANGNFTLPSAASQVTVGLAFTAQLQTLYIDTGSPTIQSKQKKINALTARVTETLGLKAGSSFDTLQTMKDLTLGNVGSMTNELVSGLVTGDARIYLDPKWQEPGQVCLQQDQPYPATILGIYPQLAVGDTPK